MVCKIEATLMEGYVVYFQSIIRDWVFLIAFFNKRFEIRLILFEDNPIEVRPIQGDVLHGEGKWPSGQRTTAADQLVPGDNRSLRPGLEIIDAKTAGKGEFGQPHDSICLENSRLD